MCLWGTLVMVFQGEFKSNFPLHKKKKKDEMFSKYAQKKKIW